jgi:hypothetical protein
LIAERADADMPNMGLTSWKGAKVRKQDITIAKNYLKEDELRKLNRFVTMYLDYAEDQAQLRNPLYMQDWRHKLDAFLQFNEREILNHPGTVAMEIAKQLAKDEYDKYNQRRLAEEAEKEGNDDDREFDRVVKRITKKK